MATTVVSDLKTLVWPAVAPTASLKVDTSCLPVNMVVPYLGSLRSKTSSPCQQSTPNTLPTPKPPDKRDAYYTSREKFTALCATNPCYQSILTIRVPSPRLQPECSGPERSTFMCATKTVDISMLARSSTTPMYTHMKMWPTYLQTRSPRRKTQSSRRQCDYG